MPSQVGLVETVLGSLAAIAFVVTTRFFSSTQVLVHCDADERVDG
jgi:hypothetical protein